MNNPRVCVVVSAYNRSDLLPGLIQALQDQTVEDFEAVLVDNGSADDTGARLRELTATDPRFRVLAVEDNRGPARARNLGWRTATAPLVAFTDDDCQPDPDWLAELVAAADDADIVQGRTLPAAQPANSRPGWFDRTQRIERWTGRFQTCNLLVARAVLDRHGGFAENFRIAMGEDTDFGLRAVANGATTAYTDAAIVYHHVWPSGFREFLEQRRRWGEYVDLMRVNPDARRLLRGGFVSRGVHLLVWALVPTTIGAMWYGVPWAPAGLVLGWCALNAYRTRHRPWPAAHRLAYSSLQFIGYAYETGCFAIASVRYRTLVI